MKSALILCVSLLCVSALVHARDFERLQGEQLAGLVNDPKITDMVNGDPNSPWKAGFNKRFDGMTFAEASRLISFKAEPEDLMNHIYPVSRATAPKVPASFDWRQQSPQCVHPVLDQAACGSCWAFGMSEALSDRFCVQSNGTVNVVLSPQPLISCDYWFEFGCNGGLLQPAWWWVADNGLVTLDCWPYQSADGNVPSCRKTCMDGNAWKTYKVKPYTTSTYMSEASIQSAILKGGPVEGSFMVFADFMQYTGGVYVRKSDSYLGGHAIKIVGWGVDQASGLPYWSVQNSWGPSWGENGYFRILRGQNECLIETNVVAGDPLL